MSRNTGLKNQIHQTGYYKLENYKNQVQIDRGYELNNPSWSVLKHKYIAYYCRYSYMLQNHLGRSKKSKDSLKVRYLGYEKTGLTSK